MNCKKVIVFISILAAVALCSAVHAVEPIPIPTGGITATASTEGDSAMLAVDGSGLSGDYPDEVHVSNGDLWWNDGTISIADEWFKVDLGDSYILQTLRVWNCNEWYDGCCVDQVDIYYSDEEADPGVPGIDSGWTLLGTAGEQTFDPAPIADGYGPPQEIPLGGITARWIGLDINSNLGDPTWVGLSELQFTYIPPPPLTMNPTSDSFTIPSDPGPKGQTITLPDGGVAPAGGTPVTLTYNESVISVFANSDETGQIASGGTATILAGDPSVTVYVSAYGGGSTALVASTPETLSAGADYTVDVVTVPGPPGIATDGLVISYRADNADGAGHPGTGQRDTWIDLARDDAGNDGELNQFLFEPGSGWVENTDQDPGSPFRYGLEFEATNDTDADYVSVNPVSLVDEDSLTYELWLRLDTAEESPLFGQNTWSSVIGEFVDGVSSAKNDFDLFVDGHTEFGHWPSTEGSNWVSPGVGFLPTGEFLQLVVTKNGEDLWHYRNGGDDEGEAVLVEITADYTGDPPDMQWIGASGHDSTKTYAGVNCQISILRIYNRALSPEEVLGNYNAEFAPPLVMDPTTDAFTMPGDPGPHEQTISLPEGETAEGEVTLTLTYNEAVISVDGIASGETATILDGDTSVTVSVSGVGTGATQLVAEAEGYSPGRASYSVGGEIALSIAPSDDPGTPVPAGTPLILDGEYILTVTVDPPVAEGGSMPLTIDYDDMYMEIEEPAIIEGGNASVELAVTADVATVEAGVWGPPTTVTASATAEYTPASADYHIGFEPGDATDDNCVNVQDLLTVRGQLGKEGSEIDPLSADIDGDGKVNVLDLLAVRGALGKGNGCP